MLTFIRAHVLLAAIALISGSALAAFVIAGFGPDTSRIAPVYAPGFTPLPQTARSRVWRELGYRQVRTLEGLDRPFLLASDASDNVYVMDRSGFVIRGYSPSGRLLATCRAAAGTLDKTFRNPTDLFVDDEGHVWVLDPRLRHLVVVSPAGGAMRTIRMSPVIDRAAYEGDGRVVSMLVSASPSGLFHIWGTRGGTATACGQVLRDFAGSSLVLDGWLAAGPKRTFVYAAYRAGVLGSFTMDGEKRFFVRTIDSVPLPELEVTSNAARVSAQATVTTLSVSVGPEGIALLSPIASVDDRVAIDTYHADDGRYLFSQRLPAGTRKWLLTSRWAFALANGRVTVWERFSGW